MKNLLSRALTYLCLAVLCAGITLTVTGAEALDGAAYGHARGIMLQIDPETEELDQVSEPVGDLSGEPVGAPTESLDEVSETDDQASEEVGDDIAPTESLDEVSETDDQASEEVGEDSETAEQASEVLPPGPEGEEYPLENQAPVQEEMPLGDREAEGRWIGE
ncbi:MAG: hypothetical protein AB1598_00620 [Thermodesulfobacteriota bacterium]